MKVYKIQHNADYCLKMGETVCKRYFASEEAANKLYNNLKERVNFANDEYVQMEVVEVEIIDGEYKTANAEIIRCYSDDTKFGN